MSSEGWNGNDEKDGKELSVSDKKTRPAKNTPSIKRKPIRGPILLFLGPPETGKTSLGQSIALCELGASGDERSSRRRCVESCFNAID